MIGSCVGQRCLVAAADRWKHAAPPQVEEVLVEELSPSGKFVRTTSSRGVELWRLAEELELVEVLPVRHETVSEDATDHYSELADALGCDAMDSHAGRLAQARKCADALVHASTYKAALLELREVMGPKGREEFVMQGMRAFAAVLRVVEAALGESP